MGNIWVLDCGEILNSCLQIHYTSVNNQLFKPFSLYILLFTQQSILNDRMLCSFQKQQANQKDRQQLQSTALEGLRSPASTILPFLRFKVNLIHSYNHSSHLTSSEELSLIPSMPTLFVSTALTNYTVMAYSTISLLIREHQFPLGQRLSYPFYLQIIGPGSGKILLCM